MDRAVFIGQGKALNVAGALGQDPCIGPLSGRDRATTAPSSHRAARRCHSTAHRGCARGDQRPGRGAARRGAPAQDQSAYAAGADAEAEDRLAPVSAESRRGRVRMNVRRQTVQALTHSRQTRKTGWLSIRRDGLYSARTRLHHVRRRYSQRCPRLRVLVDHRPDRAALPHQPRPQPGARPDRSRRSTPTCSG